MKHNIRLTIITLLLFLSMQAFAQDNEIPEPRGYHQMAYDAESAQVVIFSGQFSPFTMSSETWAFDPETDTWQHMQPEVFPPSTDTIVYHEPSDRIIAYAGGYVYGFASDPPAEVARATWTYDLNSNTWTELETENAPGATIGPRMVYDSESDMIILFGGLEMEPVLELMAGNSAEMVVVNETWAFNPNTNEWTPMNPPESPTGRNYYATAYDPNTDRVYIYSGGGLGDLGEFNYTDDMWAYDYNTDTWEEIELDGEIPPPREYSSMVYDEISGLLVLYGGFNEVEGELFGDTWSYDPQSGEWTELSPDNSPEARGWHAMAYSDVTEGIILFGGGVSRDSFFNETWHYDSSMNYWSLVPMDE